jgi:hypothetical protein
VETFIAYFDVSGHPDNTEVLSVAGYLAHKDQWGLFEKRWQKVLKKFGVPSLHMKHFAHSIGEFESWKNDEPKRRAFLSELIRLIVKTARHSFATSLYLPDYHAIDTVHNIRSVRSPFALIGCTTLQHVREWAAARRIDVKTIRFVFEDGDLEKRNFYSAAVNDLGIAPVFMAKDKSAAFQAADLLAYEHLKANRKVVPEPGIYDFEDLRQPLQSLDAIPNGDEGADWTTIERAELEATLRLLWPRLGLTFKG